MDRYLCLQAFVRIAETRSFAEAARQLNVARPVITQRISQLEEFTQLTLFHRSTRNVQLSEAGAAFLEESSTLVAHMESMLERMRALKNSPVGRLRLQVVPALALEHVDLINDFMTEYPNIEVDISADDAPVNPVDRGYDISLQIYRPAVETLIERPLFPIRRVMCASPRYIAAHGEPATPADLSQHCFGVYSGYAKQERWSFRHDSKETSVLLRPKFSCNSAHILRQFARAGSGITCLPTLVCWRELLSGELVIVLREYELPMHELLAIYSETQRGALKVKLFLDFIARRYANGIPWDQSLIKQGLITPQPAEGTMTHTVTITSEDADADHRREQHKKDQVTGKGNSRRAPGRSSAS
jgi:DNA-binding transcriptional LysR family regulator